VTALGEACQDTGPLLTEGEHHAIKLAGQLMSRISRDVIGDGMNRRQDLAEAAAHVHAIQNMILAQAAARAYPDRYRLLGGTL
jgi:broad specificity phosphatase PhoE